MVVYITKYALTQGIQLETVCTTEIESMVACTSNKFGGYYHKPDWHRTWEEALDRAEEMRQKKIVSLKKALKKMESLEFTKP